MTDADWIKQERDHEYAMFREREHRDRDIREHRTARITAVTWGVSIVLVLGILSALAYFWQASAGQRGRDVEVSCIESGGTWTSLGSGSHVCVRVESLP